MNMNKQSALLAFVVSAVVGLACSGRAGSDAATGSAQQANSPGDAGVVDPNCSYLTAQVRDDLPTGSCLRGAECAFSNSPPHCPPGGGGYRPVIANEYECTCPDGTWNCEIVHGGFGVTPCPGATDEDAGGGGDGG